jgi:hypothetical protein
MTDEGLARFIEQFLGLPEQKRGQAIREVRAFESKKEIDPPISHYLENLTEHPIDTLKRTRTMPEMDQETLAELLADFLALPDTEKPTVIEAIRLLERGGVVCPLTKYLQSARSDT